MLLQVLHSRNKGIYSRRAGKGIEVVVEFMFSHHLIFLHVLQVLHGKFLVCLFAANNLRKSAQSADKSFGCGYVALCLFAAKVFVTFAATLLQDYLGSGTGCSAMIRGFSGLLLPMGR